MEEARVEDIGAHFSKLEDPRISRRRLHKLTDIIGLSICAVIGSAEGWEDIEQFGKVKEPWLRTFLELPNGIPSHDTISRLFRRLDPEMFQKCFLSWVESFAQRGEKEVVAIDGKTMRHSFDRASAQSALHLVSAYATERGLVLGQVKTAEKSNEITAIPELLKLVDIKDAIVTIDAMGCQKNIADKIRQQGADYVLALKANHGGLYQDIKDFFDGHKRDNFAELEHDYLETTDGEHSRIDVRRYYTTSDIAWLGMDTTWKDLCSIAMVESLRTVDGETKTHTRYYLTSLVDNAAQLAHAIRSHWAIENSLHWVMDVVFREDDSRIRKDHGPENFATLRRIALNLIKNEQSNKKKSFKRRRKIASWDDSYILTVLQSKLIPLNGSF